MTEENKGESQDPVSPEEFGKLQEQVQNLNKGIATYRDSAKDFKGKYETSRKELEEAKKLKKEPEEPVKLDADKEKELKAWAEKQGFVSKDDMAKERSKINQETQKAAEVQAVSTFLEKYPEYDEDDKWQEIQSQFQLYKTPQSADAYVKLLNKIHKDLNGGTAKALKDGEAKAKAKLATKSRLSLGGKAQQKTSGDDTAIDSLQEKYPNLSRDQIESKLAEINDLYPEDEKK